VKKLNPDFLNIFCELNWDANLNGCELNWEITVRDFSVWAVSVTGLFGLGRSGLETFWSGYEILQKSYMFTF